MNPQRRAFNVQDAVDTGRSTQTMPRLVNATPKLNVHLANAPKPLRGTMRKLILTLCLRLMAAIPAVAADKQYTASAPTVTLKPGANGTAVLTVKPMAGMHFNKEFPAKFTVEATAFAKSAKDALTAKAGDVKVTGNDGVVTIPLQGLAAGSGPLTVTGNFSVCSAEQCYMLRGEKLTVQVAVK